MRYYVKKDGKYLVGANYDWRSGKWHAPVWDADFSRAKFSLTKAFAQGIANSLEGAMVLEIEDADSSQFTD